MPTAAALDDGEALAAGSACIRNDPVRGLLIAYGDWSEETGYCAAATVFLEASAVGAIDFIDVALDACAVLPTATMNTHLIARITNHPQCLPLATIRPDACVRA